MENNDDRRLQRAGCDEIRAIQASVIAIRKARGVLNPSDCELGTDEFEWVVNDYLEELERAMLASGWYGPPGGDRRSGQQ
ncbi:hypothetical protein B0G69_5552 [Paraburkholderia sp. RAU2J]|uniref:hypothetical protein n=1 Tax=Paraburkholderia sp. RAU2J TaxID=1938810 RepID=UPI000F105EC4|nr:hypothetical protein [Paraburkholderia sp. RAU2J]RKT22127.1 hypothetical protein B0G69_5552 [Paraburkholderia sp. RAU2J]